MRRIFEIDDLILVDIGNKLHSLDIKNIQELWFLAVAPVNADPGKSQPKGAGVTDDIKGKLGFCFEMHVVWDAGTFAPLSIVGPLLWQVESGIDEICG